MKILIKNTKLLSMTDSKIEEKDILIKDGKIEKISDNIEENDVKIIDGTKTLTMPGLINCHTHVGMSLFRNFADDEDLQTWLNEKIWPLEDKLTKEDVYIASMLSILEMIKTGTTTFADMYYLEDETIKAIKETGIRAQISRGLTDLADDGLDELKENVELFNKYNDLYMIDIGFGPHAIYTSNSKFLQKCSDTAKELNAPMHIHLAETKVENDDAIEKYNMTPTEFMEKNHIFDQRTIAAHGVYLTDNDLKILANHDVSVIHCPSSNLKLGSGFLDVTRLKNNGVNVALGTDSSASNNHLSMFKEMNMTSLVSKIHNPKNLNAYEVLEMATVNGAKALGLEDRIGTIEEGKDADIIIIDIDNINHTPNNNLISSLCYSTYESDVRDVIINGKLVYENRKFNGIDVDEIIKRASEDFEKLKER